MMAEQQQEEPQREEPECLLVRFEGNASKRWDGRETEVPSRTVVRSGRRGADGSEIAEVHWPGKGGKGKKVWCCVVLEGEAAAVPCAKRARTEGAQLEVETSRSTAMAPALAAGPGPSASCSSHAPERRTRPSHAHGPGIGKFKLEQRLAELITLVDIPTSLLEGLGTEEPLPHSEPASQPAPQPTGSQKQHEYALQLVVL